MPIDKHAEALSLRLVACRYEVVINKLLTILIILILANFVLYLYIKASKEIIFGRPYHLVARRR